MKSYLDPGEVKLLEEAAVQLRDSLLIHLLFRLGCRVSEALALTAQDIDFEHGHDNHPAPESSDQTFLSHV